MFSFGMNNRGLRSRVTKAFLVLALLTLPVLRLTAATTDAQWPRFRGADGNGISQARNLPVQWTESDIRWKTTLPGRGHSSPVVWNNLLFLTSGNATNATRYVIGIRAEDGKILWERPFASNPFPQNRDNSYGTSTPTVDDQGVYVYWTTPDEILVAGLSLDGQEKWRTSLGPFKGKHGSGASPVAIDKLVWINNDQDGPSALMALDTQTGAIKYKIDRVPDKVSYGTPCLFKPAGSPAELIFASSSQGLTSVNPLIGSVTWECARLFPARVVSSPITSGGLIICSCGEGGVGRRLVVVAPPTNQNPARVLYDQKKGIPNVPTPLAVNGRLYLVCDNGLIRCLRTATGEQLWQGKLDAEFYGSPVWAEDKLYVSSKNGTVFIIAAGDKFMLLGQNSLGEPSFATPAIAHNTLYFRTISHLVAIAGRQ